MNCERILCVFNTAGRCEFAPIAHAGGIMDVLFQATGRPSGRAIGCDACQEIEHNDTLGDCQGGECKQ